MSLPKWPQHLIDALDEGERSRLRAASRDKPLCPGDTIELLRTVACLRTDLQRVRASVVRPVVDESR